MITRLAVRDFQSIRKADLDLAPVSLIVGANFSGKSALLRALAALCANQSGEEFINDKAERARVAVTIDGETVEWEKPRGKGATYRWGERTFTKTGSSVPEEIAAFLGVREIEIDSTLSLTPQFQHQFHAPFILSESGSKVARILGKLTKIDRIITAQLSCKRDRDRTRREIEEAESARARFDEQLEELGDVPALREDFDLIERAVEKAGALREEIASSRYLTERLAKARAFSAVDIEGTRGLPQRARSLVEEIEQARGLERDYRMALQRLESTGAGVERTRRDAESVRARYQKQCEKVGVCTDCPWR